MQKKYDETNRGVLFKDEKRLQPRIAIIRARSTFAAKNFGSLLGSNNPRRARNT
jgi:hypothetical protein